MKKFYTDVIKFLQSEYNDDYSFNITVTADKSHDNNAVLTITIGRVYTVIINNDNMQHIYECYLLGKYIVERSQYLWQKELIDIIEGG